MSTTFCVFANKQVVEVARRSSAGKGKVQITILNPLLYLVNPSCEVTAIDNNSQGIETVGDIIHYTDDTFDDGFRPIGNRAISSHDVCIKCNKPFSAHREFRKCY